MVCEIISICWLSCMYVSWFADNATFFNSLITVITMLVTLEGWNNTDLFCIMRQNTKVWHPCPPNLLFATQFYFSGLQAESYFFQHAHWWPTQPMSKPTERKKKNSPCRLNDLMVHNDVETTQYEQNYNICLLLGFPIPFLLSEFWFHKFPKSTQFKCQIRGADREEKNQKGIKSNPH